MASDTNVPTPAPEPTPRGEYISKGGLYVCHLPLKKEPLYRTRETTGTAMAVYVYARSQRANVGWLSNYSKVK